MLQIDLTPGPVPVLLYPHRAVEEDALPPKDTVFTSSVEVTAGNERVRIGAIIAVWQSSILRTEYPPVNPNDAGEGEWKMLNTIVVTLREGEFSLAEGERQSYVFDITLPSHLPLSTVTPWERVSHVLYVFAFAPSPAYSVIPTIRADPSPSADPPTREAPEQVESAPGQTRSQQQRGGLIDSIRRLSWISSSSRLSSHSEGSGAGKSATKGKGKDGEHDDGGTLTDDLPQLQPPFPQLEEPYLAETHTNIVVTASPDAPGRVRELEGRRNIVVEGLGRIQLNMNSDMFVIGSAIMTCIYLSELNPSVTLHAVRMNLTQRLTSVDGSVTHNDQYKLYQLGKTYHLGRPDEADIVWRGARARLIDRIARSQGKKKIKDGDEASFPDSDRIHITCGPRIPSWAMGARPSSAYHDPSLSTIDHEVDVSFFWSIDSPNTENSPLLPPDKEGAIRTTSFKFHPLINSCSFLTKNIITPAYSLAAAPKVDANAYMVPYAKGTEPKPFRIKPESWIEKDRRRQRLRYRYDRQASDLRRHQVETGGLCACFYAEAHHAWEANYRHVPIVIDGELDLAPFKPVKGGKVEFPAERQRREQEWMDRHKGERDAVPGFIHMLFDECACDAWRQSGAQRDTVEGTPARKASLDGEAA